MPKIRIIELPVFGIKIKITPGGHGTITSDLSNTGKVADALDGIESLVLAHAVAGVDVTAPAYVGGVETAVHAALNNAQDGADKITDGDVGDWALLRLRLEEIIRPEALDEWMEKPNKAFGGQTPTQVMESGRADELWEMCFRLSSGMPT